MPIDLAVLSNDGGFSIHYIPLRMTRGEKKPYVDNWVVEDDWPWANPNYDLIIDIPFEKIVQIVIDPTRYMADIDLSNNVFEN